MGIYPDRGIGYLIKTSKLEGKNVSDLEIFKILHNCRYIMDYLVVISTKETDDRLIKLSCYNDKWLSDCIRTKIVKIECPKDLVLTNEEKERIKNIKGDWYDITTISMTY